MSVYTRVCVYVYIYIVFLIVYDRRIRFYNIMQLACIIKYILEFGTLVKTSRHHVVLAILSFSFVRSVCFSFEFVNLSIYPHSVCCLIIIN